MFIEAWNKHFPNVPMLGWELRNHKPELWFRLHSLPEWKRYPESIEESRTVLERHNSIAADVLGQQIELYLYWHWVDSFHGIKGTKTMDFSDGDFETSLYAANVGTWQREKFDSVTLAVANDEIDQILFLNPDNGSVYAPYDGGVDIYVFNPETKNELKDKYSDWAPVRTSGL